MERIPRRLHQLLVRLSAMSCDTYSLAAPSSRLRWFPGLSKSVQGGEELRLVVEGSVPGRTPPILRRPLGKSAGIRGISGGACRGSAAYRGTIDHDETAR